MATLGAPAATLFMTMLAEGSSPSMEALLAQAGWARRLARQLVRDAATADDLVQEAFRAALHRPGGGAAPARAWLRGTLWNLASEWRRGRDRRRRREGVAAKPEEATVTPEALHERLEAQRILAHALSELPEPYRSTVVWRYCDELSSAEIARRHGIPGGTVRCRLARGLELLRAALDRRNGRGGRHWAIALIPLAGRPTSRALAGSALVKSAGVLAMKLKVLSVAVLVLLALIAVWLQDEGSPAELPPSMAGALEVAGTPEEHAGSDAARTLATVAFEAPGSPAAPAAEPAVRALELEVAGRCIDERGEPIPGARVRLAQEDGFEVVTDAEGRFEHAGPIRGFSSIGAHGVTREFLTLELGAELHVPRRVMFSIDRNRRNELGDLVLARAARVIGRVSDALGRPVELARVWARRIEADPEKEQPGRHGVAGPSAEDLVREVEPDGRFELLVPAGPIRVRAGAPGYVNAVSEPLTARADGPPVEVVLALQPESTRSGWIRGRVVDPEGRPVKATVYFDAVEASGDRGAGSRPSREDGSFAIQTRSDTTCRVGAAGLDPALGFAELVEVAFDAGDVVIQLPRARAVTVEVRDPDGRHVPQPTVLVGPARCAFVRFPFQSLDAASWCEDGALRMKVPPWTFHVTVEATGFLPATLGPFEPSSVPATLVAKLEPASVLEGRITLKGKPFSGATVTLHRAVPPERAKLVNGFPQAYEPRAIAEEDTTRSGHFALTVTAAGTYFLHISSPVRKPRLVGPIDVRRDVPAEAFAIELGAAGVIEGVVRVGPGATAGGILITASQGGPDVRQARTADDGRFVLEDLGPGPWDLRVVDAEVPVGTVVEDSDPAAVERPTWSCEVRDDGITRVELDLSQTFLIEGRLECEGVDPLEWALGLAPSGSGNHGDKFRRPLAAGSKRPSRLDADGRFSFELRSRGSIRLTLTRYPAAGAALSLSEVLEVAGSVTRWHAALRTGRLRWTPKPGAAARHIRLTATLRPGLQASCQLDLRPSGALKEVILPAGVYELAFDGGIEGSSAELEIVAGAVTELTIP